MCSSRKILRFALWLLSLVAASALAQTTFDNSPVVSRPWMLGVSGEIDSLDAESLYATFNWGVTPNTWLYFSGGKTRFPNIDEDFTTNSFLAGIDRTFGSFGFSLDAEFWGNSVDVDSTDLRATFHYGRSRYRFWLELEKRDIDLSPLADRTDLELAVEGQGVGARVRVNLTDNWRFYLRGMKYDYEWNAPALPRRDSLLELCANDPSLVDRCLELQAFSTRLLQRRNSYLQSTLTNNSFLDSELSLNVEWTVGGDKLLALNLSTDRAIDAARSRSHTIGAGLLFPISYRMDLELTIGRNESELFAPSTFGGVFFLLYGG